MMITKNNQTTRENFSPNSNPSPPLKHLVGKIVSREKKKVYKKNQFHGNIYFKLKVINEEEKYNFFVYSNLVSKPIFEDIEQYQYFGKQYTFACEKRKKGGWNLHH
jgi:hypothetical protein